MLWNAFNFIFSNVCADDYKNIWCVWVCDYLLLVRISSWEYPIKNNCYYTWLTVVILVMVAVIIFFFKIIDVCVLVFVHQRSFQIRLCLYTDCVYTVCVCVFWIAPMWCSSSHKFRCTNTFFKTYYYTFLSFYQYEVDVFL